MLPSAWAYAPISAFKHPTDQTVQTGPFGAQLHSEDYVDEGVPFILIRNMIRGGVDDSGMPRILPKDAERLSNYKLKLNDIVFSRVGRVGSCFLAEQDQVGWVISGQLLRPRLNLTALDPRFLLHWIRSPYVERHIGNESVGSTRQSINSAILGNMPVPDLPVVEQVKIAEILDTLDTAIHETEAIIAKLKAVKQGLLHDLLTRGIDANGELRPPQAEAPHLYKESPLGWIPKDWVVRAVQQMGEVITGSTPPSHDPLAWGAGVPFVTPGDIEEESSTSTTERQVSARGQRYVRLLPAGSTLVVCIGSTIGKVGVTSTVACTNQQINAVVPFDGTDQAFLFHALRMHSGMLRALSGLQAVPIVNKSSFESVGLPCPLSGEQAEVSKRVLAASDRLQSEQKLSAKLRQQKAGLMDDLLTGRVRVTPLLEGTTP